MPAAWTGNVEAKGRDLSPLRTRSTPARHLRLGGAGSQGRGRAVSAAEPLQRQIKSASGPETLLDAAYCGILSIQLAESELSGRNSLIEA